MISPKTPSKTHQGGQCAKRLNDAIAAGKRHSNFVFGWMILDNIPPPNYTIKTLDALKEREPEAVTLIGATIWQISHRWRQVRRYSAAMK